MFSLIEHLIARQTKVPQCFSSNRPVVFLWLFCVQNLVPGFENQPIFETLPTPKHFLFPQRSDHAIYTVVCIHNDLMAGMQNNWLMYTLVNVGGQKLTFYYRMIIRSSTNTCDLFKANTLKHLLSVQFKNWTTRVWKKNCLLIKCH